MQGGREERRRKKKDGRRKKIVNLSLANGKKPRLSGN